MDFRVYFSVIYLLFQFIIVACRVKIPTPFTQKNPAAKFDNPNFVKDRFKLIIGKIDLPEDYLSNKSRHRPFNPAWMDYCDPYHCNDYHKTACGLNRANMKFKWFQSGCHIVLNNMCAAYRGSLKYDMVDVKHCVAYVMFLRQGCEPCTDEEEKPLCAMSLADYHTEIFENECALHNTNCEPETLDEFVKVEMEACTLVKFLDMDLVRLKGKKFTDMEREKLL